MQFINSKSAAFQNYFLGRPSLKIGRRALQYEYAWWLGKTTGFPSYISISHVFPLNFDQVNTARDGKTFEGVKHEVLLRGESVLCSFQRLSERLVSVPTLSM